jgi:hypothetical protein
VTELFAVTSLHSEVSGILAHSFWSS